MNTSSTAKPFHVIDTKNNCAVVSRHATRSTANRVIDRKNAEHGAYRYYVKNTSI